MIVDVATRLISEGGFNTFTLSRLAQECQMTRRGIEHHFASREAILVAVLRHRDAVDFAALAPDGRTPSGPVELWKMLDTSVERNATQPEMVRLYTVLAAEALDPSHPAHDYFAERVALSRGDLSRAARGWHPDPDAFAVTVLAVLDGLQVQWLRDQDLDLVTLWRAAAATLDARTIPGSMR